jgi:hypothetical protein
MMRTAATALALALAVAAPAAAADVPLWELGLGAAAVRLPHYRGAERSASWLLPLPYAIYRGEFLRADRDGLKLLLLDSERVHFDFSANATAPSDNGDEPARAGMPDLDATVEVGPNLNLRLASGPGWRLEARLPVRAAFTLASQPRAIGWSALPNLGYDRRISRAAMPGSGAWPAQRAAADGCAGARRAAPRAGPHRRGQPPQHAGRADAGGAAAARGLHHEGQPDAQPLPRPGRAAGALHPQRLPLRPGPPGRRGAAPGGQLVLFPEGTRSDARPVNPCHSGQASPDRQAGRRAGADRVHRHRLALPLQRLAAVAAAAAAHRVQRAPGPPLRAAGRPAGASGRARGLLRTGLQRPQAR